jgi:hypothetical protein
MVLVCGYRRHGRHVGKKLVRALVDVPRGNLQLLPCCARVAATISQAYPEVGAGERCGVWLHTANVWPHARQASVFRLRECECWVLVCMDYRGHCSHVRGRSL